MGIPKVRPFNNKKYKSIFEAAKSFEEQKEKNEMEEKKLEEEARSKRGPSNIPKREILFEFDNLGAALDELDNFISELENRLSFVLSVREEKDVLELEDHIRRTSPMGQLIYEYKVEIDKECDRLVRILERLTI